MNRFNQSYDKSLYTGVRAINAVVRKCLYTLYCVDKQQTCNYKNVTLATTIITRESIRDNLEKVFLHPDFTFSYFYIFFSSVTYFPWLFSCILNNLALYNILSVCSLEQIKENSFFHRFI